MRKCHFTHARSSSTSVTSVNLHVQIDHCLGADVVCGIYTDEALGLSHNFLPSIIILLCGLPLHRLYGELETAP